MKISLLVFDLSSNPIVRAYPIAKVLQRRMSVEILGFIFGDDIFSAYKNEFTYKSIKARNFPGGAKDIREIIKQISGDIVYTFKPRFSTYGVGLLARNLYKIPVLLDIEDYELAHHYEFSWLKRNLRIVKHILSGGFFDLRGLPYEYTMHHLTHLADSISVVSNFLQQLYGGIKLPHGADTTFFDPQKYCKKEIRDHLGISPTKKVILFTGYPREHKGLEELAKASAELKTKHNIILLIVGGNKENKYLNRLLETYGDLIFHIENQPHEKMPQFLSAGDIVVLPQLNSLYTQAQVPGKIFEAMAMAKPVIASGVSDIPEILNSCGITVKSGDTASLISAIDQVFCDNNLAEELGYNARRKAQRYYSWDAMEEILFNDLLKPWF
jgi:glycosyltransferase involved in cell wall biosynthesis